MTEPKDDLLPEGRLVRITFDVRLPAAATKEQIEDWVELSLGCGSMAMDNPLSEYEPEPFGLSVLLTDISQQGFVDELPGDKPGHRKLRFRREPTRTGLPGNASGRSFLLGPATRTLFFIVCFIIIALLGHFWM